MSPSLRRARFAIRVVTYASALLIMPAAGSALRDLLLCALQ